MTRGRQRPDPIAGTPSSVGSYYIQIKRFKSYTSVILSLPSLKCWQTPIRVVSLQFLPIPVSGTHSCTFRIHSSFVQSVHDTIYLAERWPPSRCTTIYTSIHHSFCQTTCIRSFHMTKPPQRAFMNLRCHLSLHPSSTN